MLFHTTEAWNLAEAMYADRRLNYKPYGYVQRKFEEGYQNGWMRQQLRQSALEMFVLADRAYLPPDLDIPTPSQDHMTWHAAGVNDGLDFRSPNDPLEMVELADYIIPHLLSRKHLTDPQQFWTRVKRWQKQVATQGMYSEPKDEIERAIDRERFMAHRTVQFAAHNIPTFSHIDIKGAPPKTTEADRVFEDSDAALRVIRIYFKDQIRVPAPDTFSQALDLRENARILEWRNKVRQWSNDLRESKVSEDRIKQEIDEANGYIEGADFATRLLPEMATTVALPLAAAYELFLAPHAWAHAIGFGILSIEAAKGWSALAKRAVQSVDPLKYKWLLVKGD